jgi:hypothetical protein
LRFGRPAWEICIWGRGGGWERVLTVIKMTKNLALEYAPNKIFQDIFYLIIIFDNLPTSLLGLFTQKDLIDG